MLATIVWWGVLAVCALALLLPSTLLILRSVRARLGRNRKVRYRDPRPLVTSGRPFVPTVVAASFRPVAGMKVVETAVEDQAQEPRRAA